MPKIHRIKPVYVMILARKQQDIAKMLLLYLSAPKANTPRRADCNYKIKQSGTRLCIRIEKQGYICN